MMTQQNPHYQRHPLSPRPTLFIACLLCFCSLHAQISITAVDVPYQQDFNSMANSGGSSSTMPAGWVFSETGGNSTYSVDNGNSAIEDTYSYGITSATDRAFGQLNGTTITAQQLGSSYTNNTGATITSLVIQYVGEQWRLGATGRTDMLDFQYSTNATAINNGTWTDFNALDFTAPVTAGAVGPLNGNLAANQKNLSATITGLSITNGSTFWVRWNAFNATGNDDGLAIDDFAMTANPALHYTISNNGTALSITDSDGNSDELDMTQVGSNIRFFAPGRTYSLNGGATTPFPVDIAIAGLTSIVIHAGAGNDTIDIGAFTTSLPLFTINGDTGDDLVNMNGDINFNTNAAFNADLANDPGTPGIDKFNLAANANLILAGTGLATVKASHTIVLNSGSSIVTANGNLVVEANWLTSTAGDFLGLELTNALLQITGTGSATIRGKGGTTGVNNHGIHMSLGADIIGGTSGTVTIQGTGGPTSGNGNHGLSIIDNGSTISSAGGSITITGTAGGTGSSASNYGVILSTSATISAGGAGTTTVTGIGTAATGGSNYGVYVGTTATINSTTGNVNVTGTGGGSGGTGTNNYGIYITNGGKITSGGTGIVTVNGTGGAATGSANDGVSIWLAASTITSSGGAVNVTGNGGGVGTSGSNVGVHLQSGSGISAGGTAVVNVTGYGGVTSGNNNFGVFVHTNGSSITSGGGEVTVTGEGGGSGASTENYGVVVYQGMITAGGNGDVNVLGTGGGSTGALNYGIRISESTGTVTSSGGDIELIGLEGSGPDGYAIVVHNSGSVTTAVNGGTIILTGNSMNIASTVSTNATGTMQIRPFDNDIDVNLGAAANVPGGPLNLSDAELDFVTALTLYLGDIDAGTLTVSANITRTALTHLGLYGTNGLVINGGLVNSNGGTVQMYPGSSPEAIQALQPGTEVICGTWAPLGDVLIDIDGTVADNSYTQVNVAGIVNLNSGSLAFSGTHDPQPGDQFTIVANDGADAVTNTFAGLPEGATITAFLGSDLPATISYTGGTGNDIVVTVMDPDYIISNVGGVLTVTDVAGNGETMTIDHNAPNIRFDVVGRTYSLNGGAVTNFPYNAGIAGLTSITVDVAAGSDIINVAAFSTSLPSLTLNGGTGDETINFNGDITFTANASLNVDLQDDDAVPGTDLVSFAVADTDLSLSGTGSATIRVSRSITFLSNSSITTVNGALILEANQQATPSTGTFQGINMATGSIVQATGSGVVTVKGKGGTSGASQRGIECTNCDIIGGTSGTTTIEGIGGATTSGSNDGVRLFSGGAIASYGSHIAITGTAGGTGASASSSIGVNVSTSGSIAGGGAGNVTINAYGGPATAINQIGFQMGSSSSITTNSGNITINGYGGDFSTTNNSYGVSIAGGSITAGGMGTVTIYGEGGLGSGSNHYGVSLTTTPGTITSSGGAVTVTGIGGGSGVAGSAFGVYVASGTITSGGTGAVIVNGTGGPGSGSSNRGVYVSSASGAITTGGGNLTVTGLGGGAGATTSFNHGVHIDNDAIIQATGSGVLTINGTGGSNNGITNAGIIVTGTNAMVMTVNGNMILNGIGGGNPVTSSGINYGVAFTGTGKANVSGAGSIMIDGQGGPGASAGLGSNHGVYLDGAGTTITTNSGALQITGDGGGSGNAPLNQGVWITNGAQITGGTNSNISIIGHAGPGAGSENNGIWIGGANSLVSASGTGTISLTGTGGALSTNTGNNNGVLVSSNAEVKTSGSGSIVVTGNGGGIGSTANNYGVSVVSAGKMMPTGTGAVTITGVGGTGSGIANAGVIVNGVNSIISSSGGNVSVTGTGGGSGTSTYNIGVYALDGGIISAGNTGTVTIIGTGGATSGNYNYGVSASVNNAHITSSGGNVMVTGQGGGTGTSLGNIGVNTQQSGRISAGGNGTVTVNGTGGVTAGNSNWGVFVWNDGSYITSNNGNVSITGLAGGAGSSAGLAVGVIVDNGRISAGGGGTLTIVGQGAAASGVNNHGVYITGSTGQVTSGGGFVTISGTAGSASSLGITLAGNAEINTSTNGGSIRLRANSMSIAGLVMTDPAYYTWLDPLTNGTAINLGTSGDVYNGPLQLSELELDSIVTGFLTIGSANTGTININDDITRNALTYMSIHSGDNLNAIDGLVNTAGADVYFISGFAPEFMSTPHTGTDVICNTFYPAGSMKFEINGTVADTTYTQMNVTGIVNLEDATLQLTGSHVPAAGEQFIIINNDGADAVMNTFFGLPEGATITSFLGGAYPATISYVGGTGNDVVITVSSPHYLLTTSGNQIIFTDIAGNGEVITVNQPVANTIQFIVPGRTYSLNGGAVTALPVSTSLANINMVTINAGLGNDGINVNAFANMCSLTLNGGQGNETVNMLGDISFIANANLDIDMQNDDPSPGEDITYINSNVNLTLTGTGTATVKVSRNMAFINGASLTTANGNLTLEANQQATPTTGIFYGIVMTDNTLIDVTGTGTLDVKGKGGTTNNAQIGVYLYNSAILRGGPSGDHVVTGTGGLSASNDNRGVQVQLGATITTNGGNIIINAQGGGTGASAHNHGIHVVQGGIVTAGGMGNVTINAYGGTPTGIRNHGIHVYGTGSIVTSGGGNVYVFGESGGSGASSYNHGVFVQDHGIITAGGMGTVTIEGVGGSPTGERNDGVICFQTGATITSGGGNVYVTGTGGGSGTSAYNYGVFSDFGGEITAGGIGNLYVTGTGGSTTGTRNTGVYLYQNNASMTTSGGDLHITGQGGGAGGSTENFGVHVNNGAQIIAGGTGNVFVHGTGGNTTGTRNDGVCVEVDTAIITSSGGNVEVIGIGAGNGVAFRDYGVFVNSTGIISAGGTGNVHVEGTGSPASEGIRNYGVAVAVTGSMITGSGAITVEGQGGGLGVNSNNNFGTYLTAGSIIAQGNGTINIVGTGGNAGGPYNFGVFTTGATSMIATDNGDINIIGYGAGIGTTAAHGNGIRHDAHVLAGGIGNVNIEGYGGPTDGLGNWGLVLEGPQSEIATENGDINAYGEGGGSGNSYSQLGVYLGGGAHIIAGNDGNTTVEGIGGNPTGGSNFGVYLQSAGTLISSSGGDVSIIGQGGGTGGNGASNYGIDVVTGAGVSAGGQGNVTLHGTGGLSAQGSNFGVIIYNQGAYVSTNDGDIHITGQGGGTGTGTGNIGVYMQSQGIVEAGGTGDVLIEGTSSGNAGWYNYGTLFWHTGTTVSTNDGDIEINGISNNAINGQWGVGSYVLDASIAAGGSGEVLLQGAGSLNNGENNHGILLDGATTEVTTGGGDINLIGVPGNGSSQFGIVHGNGSYIHTTPQGGNISLLANTMAITALIETPSGDTIFMAPLTADTSTVLGAGADEMAGPLMLSDMELDSVVTGTLIIGNNVVGTITVVDSISRTLSTDVHLVSGIDVTFNGGMLNTNGGDATLDPGTSPDAIRPLQLGNDVICSNLTTMGELAIVIDGIIPDTQYNQLNVVGTIDITGVSLALTGAHIPTFGDTFLIVVNDGVDPIVGTFSGLPQGGSIPSFLGSLLPATISYTGGDGNDIIIYLTSPDYLLTNVSGHLVVTDLSGNGDAMTISENGANIRFAVPGRTYSYNFNPIAVLPADVPMAGLDSLTVNGEEGHDNFVINSFITDFPAFTLNGGTGNESVTFAGDLTFQAGAGLDVDLQNDDATPGTDNIIVSANVDILFTGAGELTFRCSRDIVFNTGSYVQLEDGNVIIEANYQLVPTALNFSGVTFQNSTLAVLGEGSMLVRGKAGQTNIAHHGVRIESGTDIIGGSTADLIIEGMGAQSVSLSCYGVLVSGVGSMITSNGADVHVTGFGGGTNTSQGSTGIELTAGGVITAGGIGNLSMQGTGGPGSGALNAGIRIQSGSMVNTTAGNITMTGFGSSNAAGSQQSGILVLTGSSIIPGGDGTLTMDGTGGSGSGIANHGVFLSGATTLVTSSGGDVSVTGQAGGSITSTGNIGILVSAATLRAGDTGTVMLDGNGGPGTNLGGTGIEITASGIVTSSGGPVTVSGQGGGSGSSSGNIGVNVANGGKITSGPNATVHVTGTGGIGSGQQNFGVAVRASNAMISTGGGDLTIIAQGGGSGNSALGYGLDVEGGSCRATGTGDVFITAAGGNFGGDFNHGVYIGSSSSTITTEGGNIEIMAQGGGTGTSENSAGIWVNSGAVVSPGGQGNIIVHATGGGGTGHNNIGIELQSANSIITSNDGNVTLNGTGGGSGSSQNGYGVYVVNGAKLAAGGSGDLQITAQGGNGFANNNSGMFLTSPSAIMTNNGDITIEATGSPNMNAFQGVGVWLAGPILAGGTGEIFIDATGGPGANGNCYGILVSTASATIQSTNGDVTVVGNGGGSAAANNNYGVFIQNGLIRAGGDGTTSVTGDGGQATGTLNIGVRLDGATALVSSEGGDVSIAGIEGLGPSGFGFYTVNGSSISTTTDGGNIDIRSNSMLITSTIQSGINDTVGLAPYDIGKRIELSIAGDFLNEPLRLADGELDLITTGTLIIGDENADTITILGNITRPAATDVVLNTAGDVIHQTGSFNIAGGGLVINPGDNPYAIKPVASGTEVIAGSTLLEDALAIRINGTTVDAQYDQFNMAGSIDVNNVELLLSGSYVPMSNDSFIIVLNDGADPIIDMFAGLAEGDTIYNFLGSAEKAVITYMGGSGNDVVIRIPVLCLLPDEPVIAAMPDTLCEGTEVTLSIVSGNLGAATEWHWYTNACGGIALGVGEEIMVTPSVTTTYFARGEGGCVTASDCGEVTVAVNPFPDPTIDRETDGPCYYTENTFQPEAAPIPGATYAWIFGAGAEPLTASGYGPHDVIYTTHGTKTVKLVIHPNQAGAQCPDSSSLIFVIDNCPGQILGSVVSITGAPINNVNVKLFADANTDGLPDTTAHIRSVFTPANGQYAMASLIPGHYVIIETQPNLWLSYDDGDSSNDGDIVSNVDSLDNIIPVTVLPGETDSFNVYVERPFPGDINGVVFRDLDLDQQPDPGEGMPDVLVSLYADANTNGIADNSNVVDTAHTNFMGQYLMTDVPVGHYVIVESTPPGMASIKDFDATPDGDVVPNTNMNNDTIPVSITNDEVDGGNFFIDAESGCALLVTNANDAGPGSLRFMLNCAAPGDTIRFHASLSGDTIEIISDPFILNQDVYLKSTLSPTVTIRSGINDLFTVTAGVNAGIIAVNVVSGLSPAGLGAAIDNHGELFLHNVHMSRNPLLPPDEVLIRNHPGSHLALAGNNFFE